MNEPFVAACQAARPVTLPDGTKGIQLGGRVIVCPPEYDAEALAFLSRAIATGAPPLYQQGQAETKARRAKVEARLRREAEEWGAKVAALRAGASA
jgi:hypothetical protein